MNEFTKDELKYLHELIGSISIAGHPIDDEELESKIQSMIDNYCEHEMTQSKINDGLLYCVKCKIYEAHE